MEELQKVLNAKLEKIRNLYSMYETAAKECEPFKYLLARRYYDRDELAVYEVARAYNVYLDKVHELMEMLRVARARGYAVNVFLSDGSLVGESKGIVYSYMDQIMPVEVTIAKPDGALIVKEHILDVGYFEVRKAGF